MKYIKPPDFKSVKEFEAHYKKIEEKITTLLTNDGSAKTSKELNSLLSDALSSAVSYLSKANNRFTSKELSVAFKEGKETVKAPITRTVKEVSSILSEQGFRYADNAFSYDAYVELQTALNDAANGLKTRVNKVIEELRKQGKDSVYNVQQAIIQDFEKNGILTVEYSNGAKQPLHAYAAMAARSARIESINIGAIGRALQAGTDYVKMTEVPQCCKLCGAYQGKVYCISGKDKRFPALFETVLKRKYALPHPNCRHEFIPYFIEIEDPADVERMIKRSKIKYDKQGNLLDVRFQKDIKGYAEWQAGNRQRNTELLEFERMKKHYAGREEEMPYKTLAGFRRARRAQAESYKEIKHNIVQAAKENLNVDQPLNTNRQTEGHIYIAPNLGKAKNVLKEKFDIKSERVIITDRQYKTHIEKGANQHDDIYDQIKEYIPTIINDPDYIFESDKKADTVIFVSEKYKVQFIVKLNTTSKKLSNTIITIIGCGERTLKRLKKKLNILYQKSIDK